MSEKLKKSGRDGLFPGRTPKGKTVSQREVSDATDNLIKKIDKLQKELDALREKVTKSMEEIHSFGNSR